MPKKKTVPLINLIRHGYVHDGDTFNWKRDIRNLYKGTVRKDGRIYCDELVQNYPFSPTSFCEHVARLAYGKIKPSISGHEEGYVNGVNLKEYSEQYRDKQALKPSKPQYSEYSDPENIAPSSPSPLASLPVTIECLSPPMTPNLVCTPDISPVSSPPTKRKRTEEHSEILHRKLEALVDIAVETKQAVKSVELTVQRVDVRQTRMEEAIEAKVIYLQNQVNELQKSKIEYERELRAVEKDNILLKSRPITFESELKTDKYNPTSKALDKDKITHNKKFTSLTKANCHPESKNHVYILDGKDGNTASILLQAISNENLRICIPNDSDSFDKLCKKFKDEKRVRVVKCKLEQYFGSRYQTDERHCIVSIWADFTSNFKIAKKGFADMFKSESFFSERGIIVAITWSASRNGDHENHGNNGQKCMADLIQIAREHLYHFEPFEKMYWPQKYANGHMFFAIGRMTKA